MCPRASLRRRLALIGAGLIMAELAALVAGLVLARGRLVAPGDMAALVQLALVAGFLGAGATLLVFAWLDERLARPLSRLVAALRAAAHLPPEAAGSALPDQPWLPDLAEHARPVPAPRPPPAVGRENCAHLAKLLADVPVALLACNGAHRLAVYNGAAVTLLAPGGAMPGTRPALGRSLGDWLMLEPLEAALRNAPEDAAMAVACTPRAGGPPIPGRLRRSGAGYTLMLGAVAPEPGPVVHDLALMSHGATPALAETPLAALTCVVFDTETTGLDPARDAVVQLAALRIVNGRIVPAERFETLVDPARPIPPRAVAVHGITDAMVAGAPGLDAALAGFRAFAAEAVLVAHNAPFDMGFLQRATGGARLDHPVLDTVLISAVVFGRDADHSLDALLARLGIDMPPGARHTAPGDTLATAQAFLRMLPMLAALGIETLGDLVTALRRHPGLLRDLNG